MVSWWASKLSCQGGFEDQQADSEKADQSAQNGRFSRAESVPSPRGNSRLGEKASLEADPELALESSDVSLTYQGVTADGGLFLKFAQEGKAGDAPKAESPSLRKLRVSESRKHSLKEHKAAKQLQALAHQGKTGTTIVEPLSSRPDVPLLAILLMCTGTRGDVQPFIALGLKLQAYGHRVRLASHKPYRTVITEVGLEYYPLGGDPKVLSEYIVKNRGIIPTSAKDAMLNYKQVEDVIFSTYDACTKPDPEESHKHKPFKAQAIISNPPCYGHVHCAEKLQIPLHLLFTMPWSPTKAFPHPLARLNVVADTSMTGLRNQLSYSVVNEMVFSGLSHMINKFRRDVLQLPALRLADHGASMLETNRIPFTYCWSPTVVPKPPDWGAHIDVTGYLFLNESKLRSEGYTPPQDLADFLAAGPPPVYIGFGSLIVDDPKGVSEKILAAARHVQPAGQRILLSRGWGNLGDGLDIPDNVLQLDAVPHDWLLPLCSAVVHHGGAGTTAAGLLAECPSLVVPFFGDQAFWGAACHRLGVGPPPIPIDKLTTEGLIEALEYMRRPEALEAAKAAAADIRAEDGVEQCMAAFHHHLPLEALAAGRPVNYKITEAHLTDVVTESISGAVGLFTIPVEGSRKGGITGGMQGLGKGLLGTAFRPLKGLYLSGAAAGQIAGVKAPHQVYLIQKRGSPVQPPKPEGAEVERRSFIMNVRDRLRTASGRHPDPQEARGSADEAQPSALESEGSGDLDNATPTGTSFRYQVMPVHVEGDEEGTAAV